MAERSEKRVWLQPAVALSIFGVCWSVLSGWDTATDKLKEVSTPFYVVSWFVALGFSLFALIWLLFICVAHVRRSKHHRREARELAAQGTTSRLIRYTESVGYWATGITGHVDHVELAHRTREQINVLVGTRLLPNIGTDSLMGNRDQLHNYVAEAKALLETYGHEQAVAILARRREEALRQEFEAIQEGDGAI